jgi:L-serine dehydratase
MKDAEALARHKGIPIEYSVTSFPTRHTNTVRLSLQGKNGVKVLVVAASTGGGAFEIQQFNGFDVCIRGDFYELLFLAKDKAEKLPHGLFDDLTFSESRLSGLRLVNLKSPKEFSSSKIETLKKHHSVISLILLDPILPVISGNESSPPFSSLPSLLQFADKKQLSAGDVGILYETCRSGLTEDELVREMENLTYLIDESIKTGLEGTNHENRILPRQSHLIVKAEKKGTILKDQTTNKIIAFVTAIMEAKSALEVIVANPTAGSCGTVGGALKSVAEALNSTPGEVIKAYFAAGLIGVYIAQGPGFSAEENGCQVECGAASGMAAAGIVELMGGTARHAVSAASMAIQNMIGLICDPVADRVEVPCLGKNVSAAMNAYSSATMAIAGFDPVIPLEEVIETVSRVGGQIPACLKCTGTGGLAITPASIRLKNQFKNR